MRFSGMISIPEATFESMLESTARSIKQHGFHDVVFLGDHGGYQKNEVHAADAINTEWAADKRGRALALTACYEASQAPFIQTLRGKGFSDAEIGMRAGLSDTSLMFATDKSLVRMELLAEGAKTGPADGVFGDLCKASAELGQISVREIVHRSVQAIQTECIAIDPPGARIYRQNASINKARARARCLFWRTWQASAPSMAC
jgi:creatinine amidohydrolase/Fe(II)-dependent formamide hydrolase-like protein